MIRPILPIPHPLLSDRTHKIEHFNDHLANLCRDLKETCSEVGGLGLAAVQIGAPVRVFYLASKVTGAESLCFINPIMLSHSEFFQVYEEGCLSAPGVSIKMQRYASVRVESARPDGTSFTVEASGLFAQAIQHELNHLDGRTILDGCNPAKKRFLTDQLKMKFGGHQGRLLDYTGRATVPGFAR